VARVRGAAAVAVALIVALGSVGLLGFSNTLNPVDALLGRGAMVSVPDLAGAPRPRAEADLVEAGLVPEVDEEFSLSAPRGTVIDQRPRSGSRVREGTTVRIVVSKGANRVTMPDAVGRPFDEIAAPFEDADIPLEVERVPSERVAEGIVMEQSPGPGIQVTGLDDVSFVVSSGAADRPVPEVLGRSLDGASFELGRSALTLGEVSLADDPDVPQGAVVASDPASGEVVPIDTPIDLVISAGPALVPVPNLVNQTEQAARTTLEGAGFVVGLATQLVAPDGDGLGAVWAQFPDPDVPHRPGQTVTIVVGRELPPPPPPRSTTTTAPPETSSTTTTTTTLRAPR